MMGADGGEQRFTESIERACPDITKNDPDAANGEGPKMMGMSGVGMIRSDMRFAGVFLMGGHEHQQGATTKIGASISLPYDI